jgi:hypothetical protein
MKKTLFNQLSPENQAKVLGFQNIDLTDSLNTNQYFTQLNARDLYMLSDIFNLNHCDISFAKAMLSISELFNKTLTKL